MTIYPALLSDSADYIQDQLRQAQKLDDCFVVQVDIIDGYFVDNITIGVDDLTELDVGSLKIDLHLMTQEPLEIVHEAEDAGLQSVVRSCIGQVEHMSDQESFISDLHRIDWRAGLSIDLYTPLDVIDEDSWMRCDVIQIMGIEAGFQGQEFQEKVLSKIKEVVRLKQEHTFPYEIVVDGGVKLPLVQQFAKMGVEGLAVGSQLWQADDLQNMYQSLREAAS